jgi:MFS family permease
MVGVVLPVLNSYLKDAGWRLDRVGAATALAGLGTLLFQAPAGILTDRLSHRRAPTTTPETKRAVQEPLAPRPQVGVAG